MGPQGADLEDKINDANQDCGRIDMMPGKPYSVRDGVCSHLKYGICMRICTPVGLVQSGTFHQLSEHLARYEFYALSQWGAMANGYFNFLVFSIHDWELKLQVVGYVWVCSWGNVLC